jgi:hypothetical protein
MKIAQLVVGDHTFFLDPESTSTVLEAVRVARDHGDWVTIHNAAGTPLQLLIPSEALLVFREYDIVETESDELESHLDPGTVWIDLGY